ncbi:MAG: family 16 glycosylhydrolase, partial [Oscillospiraceae bacterium]|nr:family 16 glycosylhydrolase [Oscillospiraceae bacterium]
MEKQLRVISAAGALLLAAIVLASVASAAAKGDLNGDGSCNKSDAAALQNALLGKSTISAEMDFDGNRKVNAGDLSAMKRAILNPAQSGGREPKLPATMYSNFRSGDAGDFFSSEGWTNGRPFDCYWDADNSQIKGDHLELRIDANKKPSITAKDYQTNGIWQPGYSGGEFRTDKYYHYGYYETSMKAIKNDGVVSSFFTYTGPSDVVNGKENPWDEIDIEILGKDTTKMQVNYYVNGKGDHEGMVDLGFDASEGYHTYGFDWQPDSITWYVDGKKVSWTDSKTGKQRDGYYASQDGELPKTASKIMMNAWPGRTVDDWLKPYNGNLGLVASYEWVTYHQSEANGTQPPRTLAEMEGQSQPGTDNPQPSSGREPDLPATMYSNFRSGDAGDFFSS